MKKRIIILGAGVMQQKAIEIAKEMSLETVVCDANENAAAAPLADRFEKIDLKDKGALLSLAQDLGREAAGLAGIMTVGTDFSASVAYVAERCGLPGIPYEAALDASDKERMRRRFAEAGAPSPPFAVLREAARSLPAGLAFPVVVKPVDNMGARGCRLAAGEAELEAALDDALRFSRSGRAIVEAYMEGPEYSIDALVYQGTIIPCGLAERHIFYPPFFIEMGHTLPAALAPADEAAVLEAFYAGVRALGITCGAAKGDIKLTSGGAMIGEIAARLSGGYMSGWTYPYASGVSAVRGAICIAVGEAPPDMTAVQSLTAAERAFISIPGRVASIQGVEKARERAGVRDVFLRVGVGDRVRFPENNVEKCGNVISALHRPALACEAAQRAAQRVLIGLAAPDSQTAAFLAQPLDRAFPPSAFTLDGAQLRALAALPPDAPSPDRAPSVRPFPAFRESSLVDYAGRGVEESLKAVRALCGGELAESESGELGRGFWQAMVRGGYQGAAYHLALRRQA